jgi:hypothetical protein
MTKADFLIVLGVRGGGPAYSLEPSEGKVAAIKDAIKYEGEMSGFTLFENKDGWQMSIRPANEPGWIVQRITNEEAQAILVALENDKRFSTIDVTVGKLAGRRADPWRQQDLDNPTEATTRNADIAFLRLANRAAREALTAAFREWGAK